MAAKALCSAADGATRQNLVYSDAGTAVMIRLISLMLVCVTC
jgi:hypothetical protein